MADKPIKTERGRKPKARKFYRMGPDLRVGGAPGYRVENVMTLTGGRTDSRTARGTPRLSRISRGGAPYHRPEARPGAARPRALRELLAGLRPHEVGARSGGSRGRCLRALRGANGRWRGTAGLLVLRRRSSVGCGRRDRSQLRIHHDQRAERKVYGPAAA